MIPNPQIDDEATSNELRNNISVALRTRRAAVSTQPVLHRSGVARANEEALKGRQNTAERVARLSPPSEL